MQRRMQRLMLALLVLLVCEGQMVATMASRLCQSVAC